MGVLGFVGSLFDARNDIRVSIGFYVPILVGVAVLWWLTRRGQVLVAAWSLSIFFWLVIAFVTLEFGGLQGHNGASFVVISMLMGTIVSGRAGIAAAVISAVWCGIVAYLEHHNLLPPQLGPTYSPTNAWTALSVTLVIAAVLNSYSLNSVQRAAAERDEALRRSIAAQKMEVVGKLASGVAHDFNNLLMVISATSEQLRRSHDELERRELLRDLDEATARATLMTRQLLSFGRSQTAAGLTRVDVTEAVRAFGTMLPRLLGSKITVAVNAETSCFANANRAGLEQILLNLAVNARDAMPDGGTLTITLSTDAENVRLDFADTGVGMDPTTLEHIFQPFFTTRASGTGLGLATVHDRVIQFGGVVKAKSEPGKGTVFTVTLPRLEGTSSTPVAAASSPSITPTQARKLLLVEDDARVRRSVAGLLEQAGFEVIAVSNGAEALQLLSAPHSFVCVVSDISMPVLDGDALARKLETLTPDLPVVLMSGNRAPAGFDARGGKRVFVEKPASREALLAALDSVLGVTA
ncbi:MAG: ATP-binding protein [Archangium sp.]